MKGTTTKVLIVGAIVATVACVGLTVGLDALVRQSKEVVRRELEQALGRPVTFDTLELSFWGPPGLAANNVTVKDDPRFAATPFVHARQLRVSIHWLSLFSGKPEITGLVLEEPEIQVIRNEYGDFNIFAPTKQGSMPPRLPPLRIPITGIDAQGGTVHFVDRSSDAPAELHLRDVNLSLHPLRGGKISVNVAGELADQEHRPFAVEGTIGPLAIASNWMHNSLDLELQVASLPRAIVSRYLALLEDTAPSYLRIAGPLEINAHVSGSIAEPRISKLQLKGSLFGANAQNAILRADVDFAKDSAWNEGVIKAQFDINEVTLDQLKQVPWVSRILPRELAVEGLLNLRNTINGKFGNLTVRTTVNAKENEIRFGRWFIKQPGIRADLVLATRIRPEQIVIDESTLRLYNGKFSVSGSLTEEPEQVVQLLVKTTGVPLVGWENLVPFIAGYDIDGELGAEVSVYKKSSPQDEQPILRGYVQLADTHAIGKKPGKRNFDDVNADIRFEGKDIEIRNLQLRSGASDLALKGQLTNLRRPVLYYSLQATKLRLSDITQRSGQRNDLFRHLASEGVIEFVDGLASIKGNFSSSEGRFKKTAYRNLHAKLDWTPSGLKFKDVSFESLGGWIEGYGSVLTDPQFKFRVRISPTIHDVDIEQLLALVSPGSLEALSGRMDLAGQFAGAGEDWETLSRTLNGYGRIHLRNGIIENFNLMGGVLASLDAVQGIRAITAAGPEFTSLVQSGETHFSSIKTTFRIEGGRVHSDDLTMVTPDYAMTSNGWLDADGRLDWDANLVLSPAFSRALSTDHRNVRYLLDDRDVMSVPFHLKGRIPSVEVKPEVGQLVRFMHARLAEENGRRKQNMKGSPENSGLWNSFRQGSGDLWNSFRQLFR